MNEITEEFIKELRKMSKEEAIKTVSYIVIGELVADEVKKEIDKHFCPRCEEWYDKGHECFKQDDKMKK